MTDGHLIQGDMMTSTIIIDVMKEISIFGQMAIRQLFACCPHDAHHLLTLIIAIELIEGYQFKDINLISFISLNSIIRALKNDHIRSL